MTVNSALSSSNKVVAANCPAGKRAVGGGAGLIGGPTGVAITSTRPAFVGGEPAGWFASAGEVVADDSNWGLTVYAICAFVDP